MRATLHIWLTKRHLGFLGPLLQLHIDISVDIVNSVDLQLKQLNNNFDASFYNTTGWSCCESAMPVFVCGPTCYKRCCKVVIVINLSLPEGGT